MKSRVIQIDSEISPDRLQRQLENATPEGPPHAVLGFLPPGPRIAEILRIMEDLWSDSVRFGCEAVTQFANERLTTNGSLQLFWFDRPEHRPVVEIVHSDEGHLPASERIDRVAASLGTCDAAFLLCDGLRFPAEDFLAQLRRRTDLNLPMISGGLASQVEPVTEPGARVFAGTRLLESACLAVVFRGVYMKIEVVRGWNPASPIYTVTRGEGRILHEIEGRPATEWYRHFFQRGERMAPMPESAYRFPLIIEGPRPERYGLYRSMRFFDQPSGAVTFWGDVETGDQVRLGMGDGGSLVRTAGETSAEAAEAAVLYSCVGREMVLGSIAAREISTIHQALGGPALSGFFTFGEIGPSARGGLAFYNHTAILALLREEPS